MTPDAAPRLPQGCIIRRRAPRDDPDLVRIENAANRLLAAHGYPHLAAHGIPDVAWLRGMIEDGDVFVAATAQDMPAGFAVAQPLAGRLHLRELSVDPDHARHGIGTALVRAVIGHARSADLPGVSLTTFRDVPFNAPFYARLGFREISGAQAGPALAEAFRREVPEGVEASKRAIMVLDFAG